MSVLAPKASCGNAAATVTLAVPLAPAADAVIVTSPVLPLGAVYSPFCVIVPADPEAIAADHVNVGAMSDGRPNWSNANAVNCLLPPPESVAVCGVTVTLVIVWFTVTATWLIVDDGPSEIVTWKLYVPAA